MELAPLLEGAKAASPATRIRWRDRIAAHGPRAIEEVKPWLADPVLAAFAIRVIERAGAHGDPGLATQVLRSSRSRVPAAAKGDVDWALKQLRPTSQRVPDGRSSDRRSPPATPRRPVREIPYMSTTARRRTRRSAGTLAR